MAETIRQQSFFHLPVISPQNRITSQSWENLIAFLRLKEFFQALREAQMIYATEDQTNIFCQEIVQTFFENQSTTDHASKVIPFFSDEKLSPNKPAIHIIEIFNTMDFGQEFAIGFLIESEKGNVRNNNTLEKIYEKIAPENTYHYPIHMPELNGKNSFSMI